MIRNPITVICILAFGLLYTVPALAQQDDIRTEIEQIKQQLSEMDALKARLADLEKRLNESQKAQEELKKAQAAQADAVVPVFKGVKMKLDGRIFLGLFSSGDQGAYPNWSTDISDAKLRLTANPSPRITIVNRFRTNGAQTSGFDYFYLDYARIFDPTSLLRIGQRKIDVGQETWVDNPIENILITNSISSVSGYGTGLALRGKFGESKYMPLYEVGYVNGPRGVMIRPTTAIPFNVKIGKLFPYEIFGSLSYYDTGHLRASDGSAISVASLTNAPTGATQWSRNLWEADIRYNFGETGTRSIIPSDKLPKTMAAFAIGAFNDDATGAPDRDGTYWYIEALRHLSRQFYAASRYSTVTLHSGVLAGLGGSPIPVNSYNRTSVGLGYHITDLTDVKTEYTFNDTSGGIPEPSLNQWAIGVASKF